LAGLPRNWASIANHGAGQAREAAGASKRKRMMVGTVACRLTVI